MVFNSTFTANRLYRAIWEDQEFINKWRKNKGSRFSWKNDHQDGASRWCECIYYRYKATAKQARSKCQERTCSQGTPAECVLECSKRSFLLSSAAVRVEYVEWKVWEWSGNTETTAEHCSFTGHPTGRPQSTGVACWSSWLQQTSATWATCYQQAQSTIGYTQLAATHIYE